MTDTDQALDAVRRAAQELLPQLSERLARFGLGEIEVRSGELRMRVTGGRRPAGAGAALDSGPLEVEEATAPAGEAPAVEEAPVAETAHGVTSPAVGFFVYGEGLGPGLSVEKGDALGYVEMLGVRHDVRAPRGGMVRNLVAESGEPVEYGQVVLELEPGGVGR